MNPMNPKVEVAKRIGLMMVGVGLGVCFPRSFNFDIGAIEGIGITILMAALWVFIQHLDVKKGRVHGEKPRFTAKFRLGGNSFQSEWDMGLRGVAAGVAGIVTGFALEGHCHWEWIILLGMGGAGMAAATWFASHPISSATF